MAVLAKLGIARARVAAEKQHLAKVIIGATISRSVLGSMNDFAFLARWHIKAEGDGDLVAIALKLAEAPCGPLNYKSPEQVAREVLGAV